MSTIFFSPNLNDALIEEGRIKIEQNVMILMTKERHSFALDIGSIGYEAEPGFLGDEQSVMEKLSDTELLARFLLENLL